MMPNRPRRRLAAVLVTRALGGVCLLAGWISGPEPAALRVCADPNNLPFSNEGGDRFEDRLAAVLAAALGTRVEYTWWAQRRGFVRNTPGPGGRQLLEDFIVRRRAQIDRVLAQYGVPRAEGRGGSAGL